MKKLIFGLIIFIVLSNVSYAQNRVNLVDIPNVEVAILINLKEDNSFKDYFLVQYSENDLSKLELSDNLILTDFSSSFVKIKDTYTNKIITFTLNPEYKNSKEVIVRGYGLSRKSNNFKLTLIENPTTVLDIIEYNGNRLALSIDLNGGLKCHSGGGGASECSTSGSDMGAIPGGGGGCSVKCNPGYYACCDGASNECRCIAEKK